jgi:ABC-type transport system involved in cytochrome c biogenesis permease subunit
MLWPLLVMAIGFQLLFFALLVLRMKAMLLEARHRSAVYAR